MSYPGAEQLNSEHGTTNPVYEPEDGENCATSRTTFGVAEPMQKVVDFFIDRGVELESQPPDQPEAALLWDGERPGDEDTWAHVTVFPGASSEQRQWETVLAISRAECDLEPAAEFVVEDDVVDPTETPVAVLRNTGGIQLFHGDGYGVHRRDGERWVPFTQPQDARPLCAFTGIGLTLEPGDEYPNEISVCGDKGKTRRWIPGHYRVTTDVSAEGIQDFTLHAFFRVPR